MGLDQYAHLKDQKDLSFNTYDDNYNPEKNGFYWRKHARLQQFMAAMYREQTPEEINEDDFNLGFNGGPVIINEDVLNKLEKAINSDYQDYIATDGFFWGQQYQEEQVNNYKEIDKKFLQWCKKQVSKGNIPEYHCSW
ncbi:hypothetical protein OAN02_00175 [bacterium]|nr:hypothetical protein [bacterium]